MSRNYQPRLEGIEDLQWALGLNRFCLRWMGVWPDDDDLQVNVLKTLFRVPLMIFVLLFFLFVPQMYALVLVRSDMMLIVDNLMTSGTAFTCCWKLFFLWRSKEDDWLRSKSTWERETMRQVAFIAKTFTCTGYIFTAGSYFGFLLFPIFGFNIRLHSNFTDYGKRRLLMQTYYPYDYSKSPNYELTYLSQTLGGVFFAMSVAIPDNYFGALVLHLSAQFEVLGMTIENFIKEDNVFCKNTSNNIFCRQLGIYVSRHAHLIRMVTAVEKSFTFLILVQMSSMCIMACCLGFRLLHLLENANEKIPVFQILNLAVALVSLMLVTLADCFASEILNLRSTGIFYNIYNTKWYLVPQRSTRDFVLMMMRSKNPLPLTAGKFMYLSMSTYCAILKTIAGYISVLFAVSS